MLEFIPVPVTAVCGGMLALYLLSGLYNLAVRGSKPDFRDKVCRQSKVGVPGRDTMELNCHHLLQARHCYRRQPRARS